jgi:hypothetical protein
MSELHQLLPWYVNGTLDAEERASFEAHLPECRACRDEMSVIEELRKELRNPEWDLLADHPSPERLAAVSFDGADDAATRRHLALCPTCAVETRWLKGETPCGRAPRAPRRHLPRWALPASLAAAVSAVVVAAGVLMLARPAGHPTGLLQVDLIPSSERGQADPFIVEVPKDADDVHLVFEFDLGEGDFPASFRLVDAAGRPVFTIEKLEAAGLYRGAFLFVVCNRRDCPDAAYIARVAPRGGRAPDVEYPFRLVTSP